MATSPASVAAPPAPDRGDFEQPVDVKTAARFLGVSPSLVYAYVERKQIPHFRMMGRAIRFRLSELEAWRQQFHVNGGIR
jgi:excisionase family DNA binding protein